MTRHQLGRLSQLDKEGWQQVPDNSEAGLDAIMGGPATMTLVTETGTRTIVVDNDGSVLETSLNTPVSRLGAFDPEVDTIDQPSGL